MIVHAAQNAEWIKPSTQEIHLPQNLKPYDKEVWEVILSFHDYMDSLPAKLERDGVGVIFPYHDSNLLKDYISDKTNRSVALIYLATLPAIAYDKETNKYVYGINGTKLFVQDLGRRYKEVLEVYKNPIINPYFGYDEVRGRFQMFLQDRAIHGLRNTVKQFSGKWPFCQPGTIDEFLNRT